MAVYNNVFLSPVPIDYAAEISLPYGLVLDVAPDHGERIVDTFRDLVGAEGAGPVSWPCQGVDTGTGNVDEDGINGFINLATGSLTGAFGDRILLTIMEPTVAALTATLSESPRIDGLKVLLGQVLRGECSQTPVDTSMGTVPPPLVHILTLVRLGFSHLALAHTFHSAWELLVENLTSGWFEQYHGPAPKGRGRRKVADYKYEIGNEDKLLKVFTEQWSRQFAHDDEKLVCGSSMTNLVFQMACGAFPVPVETKLALLKHEQDPFTNVTVESAAVLLVYFNRLIKRLLERQMLDMCGNVLTAGIKKFGNKDA